MSKTVTIDGRVIGKDYPPYIIAELSANHNGNIEPNYRVSEEGYNKVHGIFGKRQNRRIIPDLRISGATYPGVPQRPRNFPSKTM